MLHCLSTLFLQNCFTCSNAKPRKLTIPPHHTCHYRPPSLNTRINHPSNFPYLSLSFYSILIIPLSPNIVPEFPPSLTPSAFQTSPEHSSIPPHNGLTTPSPFHSSILFPTVSPSPHLSSFHSSTWPGCPFTSPCLPSHSTPQLPHLAPVMAVIRRQCCQRRDTTPVSPTPAVTFNRCSVAKITEHTAPPAGL
ncbi:hypothetical protein E2C01_079245 [Portunus trituberculatus]|uniref:Uncharacterized protein n=1 Tax=Portunus trituberculatus TaxID=210409 RepID=A0A5B7IS81_PORTR|nr:hypothetical protein [Portunus trituberculatus]